MIAANYAQEIPGSFISHREKFCALLSNGPLMYADAIVVLCGEDAHPRLSVATQLLKTRGAPIAVLTGGRNEPPGIIGAEACFAEMMARSVPFDRLIIEQLAMNTHEQAENVVQLALEREWKQLLLVASPYHQYRAFLTFVAVLRERRALDQIRIVNAPASQTKWYEPPLGLTSLRAELLHTEFAKTEEYQAKGDVATYAEGIDYLHYWESR